VKKRTAAEAIVRQTHVALFGGNCRRRNGEEKLLWFCSEQVGIPAMITLSVVAAESIIRAICAGLPPAPRWSRCSGGRDPVVISRRSEGAAQETRGQDEKKKGNLSTIRRRRRSRIYNNIYVWAWWRGGRGLGGFPRHGVVRERRGG